MLPTQLPTKPILWALTATVVLAGAAWLSPRPKPVRSEERRTEVRTEAQSTTTAEGRAYTRALETRLALMEAQSQASSRQQQDVATRTVERYERYVPGPASSPAPVVVVRDGTPQPAAGVVVPQLAEVITRTIEAVDKSRTETSSESSSTAKVETTAAAETTSTEKTKTVASSETESSSTEKVTETPAPELPRLGAGYTSARQPFVSYDLTRGPKVLGLDRMGVGVFATKSRLGGLDGGPQANIALSKGKRLEPFAMVGYQVRDRTPVVGIGVKF